MKTVPIAKDALSGAYYLDVQARVWARLGDRDAAIPAIETLMKLPAPLPLTPALLPRPRLRQAASGPAFQSLAERRPLKRRHDE